MMKTRNLLGRLGWTLALALLLNGGVAVADEACPLGKWDLSVEMEGGGTLDFVADIKQNGDELCGTVVGDDGEVVDISDVKFEDGKLTFKVEREFQGQNLKSAFTGTVDGCQFAGTVDYDLDGLLGTLNVSGKKRSTLDPTGKWDLAVEMDGGGTLNFVATIKRDGDQLCGTIVGEDGEEADIHDVEFNDGELAFKLDREFQGANLKSAFRGKLTEKEFAGTVDYDLDGLLGTLNVSGKKHPPIDPTGKWNLSVEMDGGATLDFVLTLERILAGQTDYDPETKTGTLEATPSLVGTVVGDDGEEVEIQDVQLANDELTFKLEREFQGQNLKSDFRLALTKDELKGTVDYDLDGLLGTLNVSGKRAPIDIVGKWLISATADVGQTYEAVLVLSRDDEDGLSATYNFDDAIDGKVKDIKLDGDELSFAVEHDFGGAMLMVTWKGKLNGDVISGNADYELEGQIGTATFEAKRAED